MSSIALTVISTSCLNHSMSRVRDFLLLGGCRKGGGLSWVFTAFSRFAGWGHSWLFHGKLRSMTCSDSWWERYPTDALQRSHCSLLNWRGHTCPCFPYFPLGFPPLHFSKIKTLSIAYFLKVSFTSFHPISKSPEWRKTNGYAFIQHTAPWPSL